MGLNSKVRKEYKKKHELKRFNLWRQGQEVVKRGFRLSMEKKILRDTNHDCWWFCFPPDTDNGISGHAWKSQKGEFLRRWKPFTKPAPLYPFFPVPPVGKDWNYYPGFLHRLPEELQALLCLGTCPKPWSAPHQAARIGAALKYPPAASPTSFPNTLFTGRDRDWSNREGSPCSSCLACAGLELGVCWRALVPWSCLCWLKEVTEAGTASEGIFCMLFLMQGKAVSK